MITKSLTKAYISILEMGELGWRIITAFLELCFLFYDVILSLCKVLNPRYKGNKSFITQLSLQILFTGVEAFWLVGSVAFLCGAIVIIQAINNMPNFGVGEYFGNMLKIFVVRELGPIIAFLVVLGRSGTALTAYVGNMKVNKEVTALEALGIEPVDYLIMPTVTAMAISMVCLNFYFGIIAIFGGLAVAKLIIKIPFLIFLGKAISSISLFDVAFISFKSMITGAIIAIVSCYFGLSVRNIREVSMVVIKSFVISGILGVMLKIISTIVFFNILFPGARLIM